MVKTLKDGNGRYIWGDEGLNKGQPPMLCGFNVSLCEDMDAIGAGKFPIVFGDFLEKAIRLWIAKASVSFATL